jgi:hypothetical protein
MNVKREVERGDPGLSCNRRYYSSLRRNLKKKRGEDEAGSEIESHDK